MLTWQEYVAAHPEDRTWRHTQFCAGEKLFIDFAGPTCDACKTPGGESDQDGAGFDIPALHSTVESRAERCGGILGLVRNVEVLAGHVRRDGLGKPDQE